MSKLISKVKDAYDSVMVFYDILIGNIVRHPDFALAIAIVAVVGALMI